MADKTPELPNGFEGWLSENFQSIWQEDQLLAKKWQKESEELSTRVTLTLKTEGVDKSKINAVWGYAHGKAENRDFASALKATEALRPLLQTTPKGLKAETGSIVSARLEEEKRKQKRAELREKNKELEKQLKEGNPSLTQPLQMKPRKSGLVNELTHRRETAVQEQVHSRKIAAKKDWTNASDFLEEAKKLDSSQAMEQRSKLLSLKRGSAANVFGLLQETDLSNPLARRDQFWDRLSQSGSTMDEHASTTGSKQSGSGHTTAPLDIPSREESIRLTKEKLTALVSKKGDEQPEWQNSRRAEIQETLKQQDLKIEKLKAANASTEEIELAEREREAIVADQKLIDETLKNWPSAYEDFIGKYGGKWGMMKSAAKAGQEGAAAAMKAARWVRQELMNELLEKTALRCLQDYQARMGLKSATIVELQPSKSPQSKPVYLDGRSRRYRMLIEDEEKKALYGETLTLFFFAPGSTEDTSDIDMQFIVEENPTGCTELIKTFQEVTAEQMQMLNEASGKKIKGTLAEVFDMNPYPAGFVARTELGSDLHFSDTYTVRSTEAKKEIDSGLALIRRLETPPTNEKEIKTDPIEDMLRDTETNPEVRNKKLRSLKSASDVFLKSQHDRAVELLKLFNAKTSGVAEEFGELVKKLSSQVETANGLNSDSSWDPTQSWTGDTLTKEDLKTRVHCAHVLENLIQQVREKHPDGKDLVTKARNEVYLQSQRQVEELTRARDLALIDGVRMIELLEKSMKTSSDLFDVNQKMIQDKLDTLGPEGGVEEIKELKSELEEVEKKYQERMEELKQEHAEELENLRSATSALGVAAFMAQGIALNNADEAFFNRGAIGHVVEEQMGRAFVKTTGSAISSIEANAGFILEHFEHDRPDTEKDLVSFANAVGKYIQRMAKGYETIDSWAVNTDSRRRALGHHAWIMKLGDSLALLKKGRNPSTGSPLTPEEKTAGQLHGIALRCLTDNGIATVAALKVKLEEVTRDAWDAYYSEA